MILFHRQAFCTIYWPNRCILSSQFSLAFVSLVLFASEKHFFPNYLYYGIRLRKGSTMPCLQTMGAEDMLF